MSESFDGCTTPVSGRGWSGRPYSYPQASGGVVAEIPIVRRDEMTNSRLRHPQVNS